MTRKRFVKTLLSLYCSKRDAERFAELVKERRISTYESLLKKTIAEFAMLCIMEEAFLAERRVCAEVRR